MTEESTWTDETTADGEAPPVVDIRPQLAALAYQGAQLQKAFERAKREGALGDALEDKLEDWAGRVSGAYWHLGRFDGAKAFVLELSNAIGDKKLLAEFRPRIELMEQGGEDPKLFSDFVGRLRAEGVSSAEATQAGQALRTAVGGTATSKGPSGARLTAERYRTMPAAERRKLSPEQIDRMNAEYMAQFQQRRR